MKESSCTSLEATATFLWQWQAGTMRRIISGLTLTFSISSVLYYLIYILLLLVMFIIFTLDFPDSITISAGPASVEYPFLMGDYKLDNTKTAQLRKVYKKTDRDDTYIFYSSKFLL